MVKKKEPVKRCDELRQEVFAKELKAMKRYRKMEDKEAQKKYHEAASRYIGSTYLEKLQKTRKDAKGITKKTDDLKKVIAAVKKYMKSSDYKIRRAPKIAKL